MATFIERPGDEYGNIGYYCDRLYPIIHADEEDQYTLSVTEAPGTWHWPTVRREIFIEIDEQPCRLLTRNEIIALWTQLGVWV